MAESTTETRLVEWNAIKAEVAQAKDILVLGKLNYSLEAIQKWAKQTKQSLETQNEIAEYRILLNRKQGEWIEVNIPEDGAKGIGPPIATQNSYITLADAGIDRNDSPKFRILAKISDEKLDMYIQEIREVGELTTNEICRKITKNIAQKWTGDFEHYTPTLYIEAARSVMGSIDCDPASSEFAQLMIKANIFYTEETNGLNKEWIGNIFLNPPYSHPEVALFIDKLITDLKDDQQAILLTNNNTDTNFFHKAAKKASALCFTKGRISFYKENGNQSSPTNGQVFYYFGNNTERFIKYFSEFGLLMVVL